MDDVSAEVLVLGCRAKDGFMDRLSGEQVDGEIDFDFGCFAPAIAVSLKGVGVIHVEAMLDGVPGKDAPKLVCKGGMPFWRPRPTGFSYSEFFLKTGK